MFSIISYEGNANANHNHTPIRRTTIKFTELPSDGKGAEQLGLSYFAGGNAK